MREATEKLFVVTSSPHIRDTDSVPKIMWTVNIALLPALIMSVYFFGWKAMWITLLSVAAAVATEAAIQKLSRKPVRVHDGAAVITGILLAFNLPPSVPWWMPVIGSVFAIAIVKELFGGLGYNILNPALAARAFLLASWPVEMTAKWMAPREGTISGITAITSATPLNLLKQSAKIIASPEKFDPSQVQAAQEAIAKLSGNYTNLLIGNVGGCLGVEVGNRSANRCLNPVLPTYHRLADSLYLHRNGGGAGLDFWWNGRTVYRKLDFPRTFRRFGFRCLLYGHGYGYLANSSQGAVYFCGGVRYFNRGNSPVGRVSGRRELFHSSDEPGRSAHRSIHGSQSIRRGKTK